MDKVIAEKKKKLLVTYLSSKRALYTHYHLSECKTLLEKVWDTKNIIYIDAHGYTQFPPVKNSYK